MIKIRREYIKFIWWYLVIGFMEFIVGGSGSGYYNFVMCIYICVWLDILFGIFYRVLIIWFGLGIFIEFLKKNVLYIENIFRYCLREVFGFSGF